MAGSTRAEVASSSLDGSTFSGSYPTGQRGSYSGASLDRPGSFRESLDNRMSASGPSISRNSAPSMDIPSPSQYLILDFLSMGEQKYTRSGELRRVLGVSLEEHSFGSVQSKLIPPIATEDLKRFKASLLESSTRARDRSKLLKESILKLDKYRNLLSRKRQRIEISSGEKPSGSSLLKMGNQIHQSPPDLVGQRLEDRTKNTVPNKRARSSMVEIRSEGRGTGPLRQNALLEKDKATVIEKDKNFLRACNGGTSTSDDKIRGLSAAGSGWDKKMKRKRSVGMMVNRIIDADHDLKLAMQQRPSSEPNSRPCEGTGFRAGSSNGMIGSNKTDANPQLSGGNSHAIPRNEMDITSLSNEKKDRYPELEKERITTKGTNKLNIREDTQLGSQSTSTRGRAARTPRTGLLMGSSNFPRTLGSIDGWEQPSCLNKVQALSGTVNRKRPLSAGSASPPVAQWVGQRPQKISRSRRANVVSPVSNFDEALILTEGFAGADVGPGLTTTESSGSLLSRGVPNNSQPLKLKFENVPSPAVFSESEESAAMDNKSKEKDLDNGEMDDGVINPTNRTATHVLPTKKNKVSMREESGDGGRRQGRSGRTSIQSKVYLPLGKEKMENGETIKSLRSGRPTLDKNESRVGRPPSKKMPDRKANGRPGHSVHAISLDVTGESNDDREVLLAAANAARNASSDACSSAFWKKVEPLFSLVHPEDINYVKQQINFVEQLDESLCEMLDDGQKPTGEPVCAEMPLPNASVSETKGNQTDNVWSSKSMGSVGPNDLWAVKKVSEKAETQNWFENIVPLSQRLLSAFVIEVDREQFDDHIEQCTLHQSSINFSQYGRDILAEDKVEFESGNQKHSSQGIFLCNGYAAVNKFGSPSGQNLVFSDAPVHEDGIMAPSDVSSLIDLPQASLEQLQNLSGGFSSMSNGCHYEDMPLNERLLMELHSIDLYPDAVPDLAEGENDEIDREIMELRLTLCQQVRSRKSLLQKLAKAMQDTKEIEDRKLEQLAMDKLVEMAYKKVVGGRGTHGSNHKGGVAKVSKQLAQAFALRTLARCKKFEETGKNCFSEPTLHEVIFAAPPPVSDAKYEESRIGPLCSWVSGSMPSAIERNGLADKLERGSFDPFQSTIHMPGQAHLKPDLNSSKGKRREVLLDDVVTSAASRMTSTLTHSLPGGIKGKRSDRDRDGNKDVLARNSTAKGSRPSSSNAKGERKAKTKPKQKIAQLSASGNGLLGRITETKNAAVPSMHDLSESTIKANQNVGMPCSGNSAEDLSSILENSIFTNLPLHGIDSIEALDVAEGLDGQGQDIGTWLSVDDDLLQDHDLVGLEIPMDDLSDLKLNF